MIVVGAASNVFAVALAAVPARITSSRRQLADWLSSAGVTPCQAHDILLAVSEAVTNAIEHGSRRDAGKLVTVRASVCDETVTATVSDSGRWIHPAPHAASLTQRGRGLIIIRAVANSVEIARTAFGTQITMQFDVPERVEHAANQN